MEVETINKTEINIYFPEIYPYCPKYLYIDYHTFVFNSKLNCKVFFEENSYIISCAELNITVGGKTREATEDAFSYCFYLLYKKYYCDNNLYLNSEETKLKQFLYLLIRQVLINNELKINNLDYPKNIIPAKRIGSYTEGFGIWENMEISIEDFRNSLWQRESFCW